ncbi:MAG: hypothetical protein ABIG46_01630 [Candidatus Omnitrophota bacterium]|nr:hypothetical protein [Candidatus Omnitrophota bacterium]
MSSQGKVALIVLIFLLIVSVTLGGWLYWNLDKERQEKTALQEEANTLNIEKRKLEAKLSDSIRTNTDLAVKISDYQRRIEVLNADIGTEVKERQQALGEIDRLKVELTQAIDKSAMLEKKFDYASENIAKLQDKLVDLNSKLQEQQVRAKNVELGKIVVNSESRPEEASNKGAGNSSENSLIEGKVLVVNKEHNFVVINVGSKNNVELGDVFALQHNNQYLGDVKVEKVHDTMSAAGFLSNDIKDKVAEGDKAVFKSK